MLSIKTSEKSVVAIPKDDHEFKKPLQPAPRKKKVLDEETYVKKLESIIERDFFPDLTSLSDKLEYLEASETNDITKLRELFAKYSEASANTPLNPADSPATFDTPVSNTSEKSKTPPRDTSDPDAAESTTSESPKVSSKNTEPKIVKLDQFMCNYTSEDNESFEQVMKEQEKKWKLKHPWLYEAEDKHNSLHTPNLGLPSIEEQKNSKILALTGTSDKKKDTRPLSVDNWTYTTFNSVMFVPHGAPLSKNQLLEKAKIKEREVCQENTRYQENPFSEALSQATMQEASAIQAYKKEGKVGIDGKELRDSPRVNGYSYMRSPSPVPGVDCSPLMTWGQIDGTPFQLDGSQTPLIKGKGTQGPSYKIPKASDRDQLLIKLSEKVNQTHRDRKSKALSTARSALSSPSVSGTTTPNSRLETLSSLSPAAQKLFTYKLGVNKGTDRALRASYTPSPVSCTPNGPLTPSARSVGVVGVSPKSVARNRPYTPGTEPLGLTDNLLNLPKRSALTPPTNTHKFKRKCAADFF